MAIATLRRKPEYFARFTGLRAEHRAKLLLR